MPEKRRAAFRPERLQSAGAPNPIIPQILGSPAPEAAGEGFTEVRIVGVGGAGINAVGRMIEAGLSGVRFIAVNTDVQALGQSEALIQVQIGRACHRRQGHRRRSGPRSARGRGKRSQSRSGAARCSSGVHRRRSWRRHRHRRRAGDRQPRAAGGGAHRGGSDACRSPLRAPAGSE